MKVDRSPTKPNARGKSKTLKASPTHKVIKLKPHEKKTESKHAENDLRESEERFRALIENASDMILTITADGNLNYVSPAALRITGYQANEVIGRNIVEFIHADDLPLALQALASRAQTPGLAPAPIELRFRNKDGMWRDVEILGNNLLDDPLVNGIVLNVRDITKRKRAEAAVRESEKHLHLITDNMEDLVVRTDLQGLILYASPSHKTVLGYEPEYLVGKSGFDLVHSEDLDRMMEATFAAIRDKKPDKKDYRYRHADGHYLWLESAGAIIFGESGLPVGAVFSTRDITERKLAEQELRESEERYRLLVETLPDGVVVHSHGRIVFANPASAKIIGAASPADLTGKPVIDFVHPDYQELALKRIQQSLSEGIPAPLAEEKFMQLDGTPIDVEVSAIPISYAGKSAMLTVINDITERKQAEEALRENEKTFRSLFENMLNGFAYCQMLFEQERPSDFIYLEVNKAFETLTGLKNVVGKKVSEVIPGIRESDSVLIATYGRVALTGIAETFETYVEALRMWFSISVYSPKKEYFVAVFDVITERKQAEEVLRTSEERLRVGLNTANIAVFNQGLDLRYDWMYQPQLGYTSEQVMGHTDADLLPPEAAKQVMEIKRRVLEGGLKEHAEVPVSVGGQTFVYDLVVEPLRDASGAIIGLTGASLDITERKQAEEALRNAGARYRTLFEQSPNGVLLIDLETGKTVEANETAHRQLGYTREEFAALRISDYEASEKPEETAENMRRIIREGSGDFETLHRTKSGVLRNVHVSVKIVQLNNRDLFYAIFQDITERKQAEAELLKLRKAVDTSGEAIFMTDRNGLITFVNPEFTRLYGYTAAEVLGQTTPRILKSGMMKPEEYVHFWQTLQSKQVVKGELVNKTKDGRLLAIEGSVNPILGEREEIVGFLAIQRDITERKRAEEALRQSERNLTEAQRVGRLGSWDWDAKTDTITWSEAYYHVYGFDPTQPPPGYEEHLKAYTSESAARLDTAVKQCMQTGEGYELDLEQARPDGTRRWVTASGECKRDAHGRIVGLRGTAQDITERKQAEEALRESEERFRALVEHSHDAIALLAADGTVLYDSPSIVGVLGYNPTERIGRKVFEFVHPEERQSIAQGFARFIQQQGMVAPSEGRFLHKDGTLRQIEGVRTNLLHEPAVRAVVVNYRDITERKQAEEEVKSQLEELQRWQDVMLGRGDGEQKLKREVNELCRRAGESARYPSQEIGAADSETAPTKS